MVRHGRFPGDRVYIGRRGGIRLRPADPGDRVHPWQGSALTKRNLEPYTTAAVSFRVDGFAATRTSWPFCAAFVASDGATIEAWGRDCVAELMARIGDLPEQYLVFVNVAGGNKIALHFLWDVAGDPVTIIAGNLVEWSQDTTWRGPRHVWRDAALILPFLEQRSAYAGVGTARNRRKDRAATQAACMADAAELLAACAMFRERFEGHGYPLPLSLGALALREFTRFHQWEQGTKATDAFARPWYFGGRTQSFRVGLFTAPPGETWKIYDCNSHYGAAMVYAKHPDASGFNEALTAPRAAGPWFARITAENAGALPWRAENGDILWDVQDGEFLACGHELVPAIKAGRVRVKAWREVWTPAGHPKHFARFVNHWMAEKDRAEVAGDTLGRALAKTIIASASGKLGQNPNKYQDYLLSREFVNAEAIAKGYSNGETFRGDPEDWLELLHRPATIMSYMFNNVAMAASITSASRASMAAALELAETPLCCDTDNMVCRSFAGDIHPSRLGAWKLEAEASHAAIVSPRCYCLYDLAPDGRPLPVKVQGDKPAAEVIKIAREIPRGPAR
jgi:hypothetical protein